MNLFFLLIFGHVLADFPLQGDFLAKYKNLNFIRNAALEGPWWLVMSSHCYIHAAIVGLLTGSYLCGIVEFISHFVIDTMKTKKWISFGLDQALHVLCKVAYTVFIAICTLNGVEPL